MGLFIVTAGDKEKYIQEFGNWMDKPPWQKFLTLTFANNRISITRAKQLFDEFVITLGEDVYFVVVYQRFYRIDPVHVHSLMYGVTEPIIWVHGTAKVYEYDATKRARFYIGKHLDSGKAEWDFHLPLPANQKGSLL